MVKVPNTSRYAHQGDGGPTELISRGFQTMYRIGFLKVTAMMAFYVVRAGAFVVSVPRADYWTAKACDITSKWRQAPGVVPPGIRYVEN